MRDMSNIAITIVHGTGLKSHKWAKPDSDFAEYLRQHLSQECAIDVFNWSGFYAFRSRSAAAKNLADYLRNRHRELPNAKHITIAHSHGGNVLLQALRDGNVKSQLSSIVFLSTPFLHIKKRPAELLNSIMVGGLMFIILVWLKIFVMASCGIFQPAGWWHILGTILNMVLIPIAGLLMYKWREWSFRWAQSKELPIIEGVDMLILRKPADEASVVLLLLQSIELIINRLWQIAVQLLYVLIEAIYNVWNWMAELANDRWIYKLMTAIFLLFAGCVLFLLFRDQLYPLMEENDIGSTWGVPVIILCLSFWAATVPAILLFVLFIVACLLTLPFLICSATLLFFIGPELALTVPFMEVSVELGPPGKATIFHSTKNLFIDDSSPDRDTVMAHATYNDPECREVIVKWINGSL